jgi:hypothetical protein
MTEINLRKTLARFVYFIEQSSTGKSKESILKELELTELEFQFLLTRSLIISKLNDNEAMIVTPVEEEEISIGGVMLRFHNKDLMSL